MPLFVVGTPIGNLSDITERAKEVIKDCDIIICENKERALKILRKVGADYKDIIVLPPPKEKELSEKVLQRIKDEKKAAMIVSAGTPGISDPGSILVKKCIEEGIQVIPVPGVSAITCALSVSGFDTSSFLFLGFPPKKGRKNFLRKVKEGIEKMPFTPLLVMFESPHRIIKTLRDIKDVFENVDVFLAREMTKIHEEYIRGKINEVIQMLERKEKIKGEITVIFAPKF